jgi:integrase
MPMLSLNKTNIERLTPQATEQSYWDPGLPGFALKVTPAGKKVFFIKYRMGGRGSRQRKLTIGPFGNITPQRAREVAMRALGEVAKGIDPQAEKLHKRRALASDKVADLVERFLTERVAQDRTARFVTLIFRRDVLPTWGAKSVHEVTKRDINHLLAGICARGAGVLANRTLGAVRRFFNWCVSQAIIEKSPCDGVMPPVQEQPRDRYLSEHELKSVLNAAQVIGYPFGYIVELLILTGQRKNEVARMTWSEVDFRRRTWTIPAAKSKSNRSHLVHLTDRSTALLAACPKIGTHVFTTNGRTEFQGFSKCKQRLDELAGVKEWTLHDLRRTIATGMADLGVAPHVADKVLNHRSGAIRGVAAIYQRNEFLTEREAALTKWSHHVSQLARSDNTSNVVHMGCPSGAGASE